MKTIVVGAGPAGIMASLESAKNGDEVLLLEKNNEIGKKLKITGKGRCNITSSAPMEEYYSNIFNSKFLMSAFNKYTNQDIVEYLNENGVKTKIERGCRVFPVSDKASEVVNFFYKEIQKRKDKIELRLNSNVTDLIVEQNVVKGVKLGDEKIFAEKVIIATGGMSYQMTGSDGKMLDILKKHGVDVKDFKQALSPLEIVNAKQCKDCMGLSLRNVDLNVEVCGKNIYSDFGEMVFTHYGISGPIVLSASSYLSHYKNIEQHLKNNEVMVYIDLKPALDFQILDRRVLRDFQKYPNKQIKNALFDLLPKNIIPLILQISEINDMIKVNDLTKEKRVQLVNSIKKLPFVVKGFRPIEESIVSNGGVVTKTINPKTMMSKQIGNLYFAGEVIDVDGLTGGFNLQIAYSTGVVAGGRV